MSDDNPFQEKPDWRGKLKSALQKSKDDVTGFLTRKKSDSPLAPGAGPETDGHTMTDMIKMAWNNRVKPRFTKKKKKDDGGAFSPDFPPPSGGGFRWTGEKINVFAVLIALLLIAWTGADLVALFVEKMIPEAPIVRNRGGGGGMADHAGRPFTDYQVIIARNLFNSLGRIPGDQAPGVLEQDNDPVKTGLPLNLIGTVILRNELRSVATIEDKGENQVYPVRVDDEVPGKIKILSIEAYKVVFRNLSSGRKEYIDMPEEGNGTRISVGTMSSRKPTTGETIEQTAPNTYNIARSELDKQLSNINEVLTQARAIPHFENGQPAGFKLIQIVQGSVYEKLGLKNGDVLKAVNGEPVDAAKAFEMMGMLKTVNQLELTVQRDGRTNNMNYNFR